MKPMLLISNRILVTFLGIFFLFYTPSFAAVSNRDDINREALFDLAFENLGLYMIAVEREMRLTPLEKKAFGDIARIANMRRYGVVYQTPHFELEYSNDQNEFLLDGDTVRTAVTTRDPLTPVKVNLKIIQDKKSKLDLLEAIQIMIHEFSHKTSHSGEGYVDRLAAKVVAALKNHFFTFPIEPGYKISILGLTSPFISLYNDLAKRAPESNKQLGEILQYHYLYSGSEATVLEYRGNEIRIKNQISGYLKNPVGFSNVPQGTQAVLIPMSMTEVQDVRKEQLGDRFPRIVLSTVTHQLLVEYINGDVLAPKTVGSSVAHQMSYNTVRSELVIYTDRTGIKSISKREYSRQYLAEASIEKLNYNDGLIEGSGVVKVLPDEFEYMKKKGLNIEVKIKFKDGQTLVPAKVSNDGSHFIFSFSLKATPVDGQVAVDQILLGTINSQGRYEGMFISLGETKTLNVPSGNVPSFKLLAWRLNDHHGETYLHTGPLSSPIIITEPDNNITRFHLDFLFRSETPIVELVLHLKSADKIMDENGLVKYARYYETHHRLSPDQFVQQKVGPYYKVFVDMGGNKTPVIRGANDAVAVAPEDRIQIVKMRAINEGLQILGTDDALTDSILNHKVHEPRVPKACRTHF